MPFPVSFANASHATPRDLAVAVMTQLSSGQSVHAALIDAAAAGDLSTQEATGLAAALVQTRAPAAVIAGCHLARHLGQPSLAELLIIAHDALDMGTLLQQAHNDQSIEDLLLGALAACVGEPGKALHTALTRLRHAGLNRDELLVLLRVGDAHQLTQALPAIVLEGLPPDTADAVAQRLAQGDDTANALAQGLVGVPPGDRATLWAAIVRHGVRTSAPQAVRLLFPQPDAP